MLRSHSSKSTGWPDQSSAPEGTYPATELHGALVLIPNRQRGHRSSPRPCRVSRFRFTLGDYSKLIFSYLPSTAMQVWPNFIAKWRFCSKFHGYLGSKMISFVSRSIPVVAKRCHISGVFMKHDYLCLLRCLFVMVITYSQSVTSEFTFTH